MIQEHTIDLCPMRDCDEHNALVVRLRNANLAHFCGDKVLTLDAHRAFLLAPERANEYNWLIQVNGILCGTVSVYHIDAQSHKCEWGRFVVDALPGVGSAVLRKIVRFAFYDLCVHKLYCEVFATNTRAINLYYKQGFRLEAIYRDHVFKGGSYHDVLSLALLKPDWEQAS